MRWNWRNIDVLKTDFQTGFLHRGDFRKLALPDEVKHWSLTTLRDRLVKIGARIVRHGRSITFQLAEVMVPRALFPQILAAIAALRPVTPARC